MKKLKLFSLFLLILVIAAVFTINVFAEDIDYNNIIVIDVVGGHYTFSFGMSGSTWENYIDYQRTNGITNFTVLNNYVLFEGNILINKLGNPVKSSDTVIAAAGCVYTTRLVFNYNGTGYYFDEIFNNTTFYQFVNAYEDMNINIFSLHGNYGNYYVYFNNFPLMLNDVHVNGNYYISSDIYTVDNDYLCEHDYIITQIIEYSSCVSTGSCILECRKCGNSKQEETPIDRDAHHFSVTSSIPATCTENGEYKVTCSLCNFTKTDIIKKLSHKFEGATCTSPDVCIYCGEEGEPLGHDKNFIGWCERCKTFPPKDEDKSQFNFEEWWSGVEQWFSDVGKDVDDYFTKISNGIKATAIVCGIFVLLVGVYYVLSFVNNVNTFKDRWKEYRNNRQNKGNKRK